MSGIANRVVKTKYYIRTMTTTTGVKPPRTEEESRARAKELNRAKEEQKKNKQKAKAEQQKKLANPDKIIENILSKSSFKIPNLSQIAAEQLYAPDYYPQLSKHLRDVEYRDAIGHRQLNISVLPSCFDPRQYRVNVDPSAITSLGCIHEKPEKRDRRRFKRGKNKRGGKKGKGAADGGGPGKSEGKNQNNSQIDGPKVKPKTNGNQEPS